MEDMSKIGNKAFSDGKPPIGSTRSVSHAPLFIDARVKENKILEKIRWRARSVCLLHGERFSRKKRCSRCRYLIKFQMRSC